MHNICPDWGSNYNLCLPQCIFTFSDIVFSKIFSFIFASIICNTVGCILKNKIDQFSIKQNPCLNNKYKQIGQQLTLSFLMTCQSADVRTCQFKKRQNFLQNWQSGSSRLTIHFMSVVQYFFIYIFFNFIYIYIKLLDT